MNLPNPIDNTRPKWMQHAACKGMNPNLFMPERGDMQTLNNAKAVCATCPVKTECLEYGLEEKYGVWGGLAEGARRKLRSARFKAAGKRYYPRPPIEHGTSNGYLTHRRRNEEPCGACLEARRVYNRLKRQRQRETRNT